LFLARNQRRIFSSWPKNSFYIRCLKAQKILTLCSDFMYLRPLITYKHTYSLPK
jgi:hypothetical protein